MEVDKRHHVVELQSLRGIAALTVLIGHAASYFRAPLWFEALKDLFNGHAAVVMFFLLSGYVLVRSLAHQPMSRANLTGFYVKRLFRIFPALWAASFAGLIYLLLLHYNVPVAETSEWFDERFQAARMHPLYIFASFAGMLAFILPQIWSVTVEIFGSILLPGIAYLRLRAPRGFAALLAICLVASFTVGPLTYYSIGVYLLDFVLGASLFGLAPAVVRRLQAIGPRSKIWLFAVAAAVLMFARDAATVLGDEVEFHGPGFQLIEAVCALLMIALIVHGNLRLSFLRARPVVLLGDVSYSLYLWSFPVMCVVAKILAVGFPLLGLPTSTVVLNVLLPILTVIIVIPLARLSYHAIELPGIALGREAVRLVHRSWPLIWRVPGNVPPKAKS